MARVAVSLALVIACSSSAEAPRTEPPPAGTARAVDAGAGAASGSDPAAVPPERPQTRPARAIEIVLRSSPAGATVSVDGAEVGRTPTYWAGEANGHAHEFTFELPRHAPAHYRFVPITSGVVHARLETLDGDAGVSHARHDPAPRDAMPRGAPDTGTALDAAPRPGTGPQP